MTLKRETALSRILLALACCFLGCSKANKSQPAPKTIDGKPSDAICDVRVVREFETRNRTEAGAEGEFLNIQIVDENGEPISDARLMPLVAKFPELGTGIGIIASSERFLVGPVTLELIKGTKTVAKLAQPNLVVAPVPLVLDHFEISQRHVKFFLTACGSKTVKPFPRQPLTPAEVPADFDLQFRLIHPGSFYMGSPDGSDGTKTEPEREADEVLHRVTITDSFEMQAIDVTQSLWVSVMGYNPSFFTKRSNCPTDYVESPVEMCPHNPVEQVSYEDVSKFISRINILLDSQAYSYRLPTEAEWEFCTRAGQSSAYYFGDIKNADQAGWHRANSLGQTQRVASLRPNTWGLFDMTGNIWRWTGDWYGPYSDKPSVDPRGPTTGTFRVLRGGSWFYTSRYMRSAARTYIDPNGAAYLDIGFRLVRVRKTN